MKSVVIVVVLLLTATFVFAQVDDNGAEYREFWSKTEAEFKNQEESPLPKNEISDFDSIPKYLYDPKFRVEARWEERKYEKPFKIETSDSRKVMYQKVAVLHFKIGEDSLQLAAYQSLDLMRSPAYKDYIFLPYTDETNGFDTYGGGRYIDFEKPESDTSTVILDFNMSYNPYCAYNDGYSCPIPPRENNLNIKIEAGARYD